MHILYYITGHGFGHGVRSCVICNAFSDSVSLTIRSSLPRQFFEEELRRPFQFTDAEFDCGCAQLDGATVDIPRTLNHYASIAERNRKIKDRELRLVEEEGFDAIVSDITPFAFEVAHQAGIPSFGIGNFSWYDIYLPYTNQNRWFRPFLDEICAQYQRADHLLKLQPANTMDCFNRVHPVPLVARKGENRARQIRAHFGIPDDKRLAMIYAGNYGMDSIDWTGLKRFDRWVFLGVYPVDSAPANFHLVSKKMFAFQDLSASVDLIIGKIGYGILGECLVHGVPLMYVPREDFAEHPVLEEAVLHRGGACRISRERFYRLDWDGELDEVIHRARPVPQSADGDRVCARYIQQHASPG